MCASAGLDQRPAHTATLQDQRVECIIDHVLLIKTTKKYSDVPAWVWPQREDSPPDKPPLLWESGLGGSDRVRLCPGGGGGGLFLDRVELPPGVRVEGGAGGVTTYKLMQWRDRRWTPGIPTGRWGAGEGSLRGRCLAIRTGFNKMAGQRGGDMLTQHQCR